ncbi:MAG TPA: STAS domain-containing protein [Rhodocyclaceae bacterium]|nr:STAS domain-containing protein [Rhodocyclaceae bacterium]
MAFSLFGKKPTEKIGGARPPARAPGKPAPSPEEARPAKDLPNLDFTSPPSIQGPASNSAIQVEDVANLVPPAIEQAAMLHSANQPIEACRVLEAAVRAGKGLGNYEKRAWGMLFDLYQSLGKRDTFESLALDFAARFETSPPTWNEETQTVKDTSLATGGRAFVALAGVLNAKAQDGLKQLLQIAEKNPVVRLDLTKVSDADENGCAMLLATLRAVRKAKKECVLGGADNLAAILSKKISTGRREMENTWLLLMELYEQLFQQEAFDETAVNYAITFEVSPPSWAPPKAKPAAAPAPTAAPASEGLRGYILEGDIASAGVDAFAPLRAFAEGREEVRVDCSKLVRMDFVSAAQLLNVVAHIQAAGKKVRLRNVSNLVAALWEVLGLDRVATIETRKS